MVWDLHQHSVLPNLRECLVCSTGGLMSPTCLISEHCRLPLLPIRDPLTSSAVKMHLFHKIERCLRSASEANQTHSQVASLLPGEYNDNASVVSFAIIPQWGEARRFAQVAHMVTSLQDPSILSVVKKQLSSCCFSCHSSHNPAI